MTPAEFYQVVELLVVLAVILWFFTHPWQALCTDASRHRHFELRDRLFMLAANGLIDFNSPIYQALRQWLNDRIRLAHVNLFGDMLATVVVHRGVPDIKTLYDEIEQIDDEGLRKQLQAIYFEGTEVQLGHMMVRSPVLMLLLAVLAPAVFLIELIDGSLRRLRSRLTNLAQIADAKALQISKQ